MVIPQIINLTTKMKKRHIYTVMNTSSPCTKKRNVQENKKKPKNGKIVKRQRSSVRHVLPAQCHVTQNGMNVF